MENIVLIGYRCVRKSFKILNCRKIIYFRIQRSIEIRLILFLFGRIIDVRRVK